MEATMRQVKCLTAVFVGGVILAGCSDAANVVTEPGRRNVAAMDLVTQQDKPTSVDPDSVRIVRASGDISADVNEFRALLGTLNANIAGEQPDGRREVNWDGVPPTLTNNDLFPGDFFNVVSPRGLLLTTDGPAFRI